MNQLDKRDYQILNMGAVVVPGIILVAYFMIAWETIPAGLILLGTAVVADLLLMLPLARVSTEPLVTRQKSAEGFAVGVGIVLLSSFLTKIPEYEALAAHLFFDKTLADWRPITAVAILIFLWIQRRRASIKKLEVDRMTMIYGSMPPQNSETSFPNKQTHTTAGNASV